MTIAARRAAVSVAAMQNVRLYLIFVGVMLTGFVMGAVAGGTAAAIVGVVFAGFGALGGPLPFVGAVFGAILGSILAPLAAFTMLRHVPLWRLFAEVTVGTIIGSVATALVHFDINLVLCGAVAGFFAAALRLGKRTAPAQPPPNQALQPTWGLEDSAV